MQEGHCDFGASVKKKVNEEAEQVSSVEASVADEEREYPQRSQIRCELPQETDENEAKHGRTAHPFVFGLEKIKKAKVGEVR